MYIKELVQYHIVFAKSDDYLYANNPPHASFLNASQNME